MTNVCTKPDDVIASLGLTVESMFVPFSQSRNAKPGPDGKLWQSLNWRVTLKRNGRDVMTADYAQGAAHCPSYGKPVPAAFNRPKRMWPDLAIAQEIETGCAVDVHTWGWRDGANIEGPKTADVLSSLISDASAMDHADFESWAAEYGYDTDSRSAENTYRACLETGLKLRAAIGDEGFRQLQEVLQDY